MTAVLTITPDRLGEIYQEAKDRIAALVCDLGDAQLATTVAACPEWSVRDVVAHLAGVADDWGQGRLTSVPTDEQTAAQVARFDGRSIVDIVSAWGVAAAHLSHLATAEGLEPPIGDVTAHEHDVRAALGRPAARDSAAVAYTSDRLLTALRPPVPLRVTVEDAEYRSGPAVGSELHLCTTRFEVTRWRTGRRSHLQLVAMDWSDDPTPVLDHLCMFGPARCDIDE